MKKNEIKGSFFMCNTVIPGRENSSNLPIARSFYTFGNGLHFFSEDEVNLEQAENLERVFGIKWRDVSGFFE